MNWLLYAILAIISLGFSMVFYKLPSYKNHSSFISTIVTNTLSASMVVVVLYVTGKFSEIHGVSWYGLAWGATFAISMVLFKKLLNGREAGVIFPVVSSVGNAVTILVGIVFLTETISLVQALGIITILLSVYFFQKKSGTIVFNKEALWLAGGIIVFSTAQKFIQKLGAEHESLAQFMAYQYLGAALFGFVLTLIFQRKHLRELRTPQKYMKGALLISIFSVIAGYSLLKALTLAPLSKVYAVQPMYTLVTALLGVWLFKEGVTARKIGFILLSILGVLLLRIG